MDQKRLETLLAAVHRVGATALHLVPGRAPTLRVQRRLVTGDEAPVEAAAQNLMLAARALGIGSVPTTLHPQVQERVYALLGIPSAAGFHLCIPLGYPRGRFGPTDRRPITEITFLNHWGTALPAGEQAAD